MFSTTNRWIRAGLGLLIIPYWFIPSCVFFISFILCCPSLCWVALFVVFRVEWANVVGFVFLFEGR